MDRPRAAERLQRSVCRTPLQHLLADRPLGPLRCTGRQAILQTLFADLIAYQPPLPPTRSDGTYRNITLRNVTINNSAGRYGANVLINSTNPATGIVFDSVRCPPPAAAAASLCIQARQVRFNNPKSDHVYLSCDGVSHGVATGNTWPIPPCFTDRTTPAAAGS
jgi:hypothetical protein